MKKFWVVVASHVCARILQQQSGPMSRNKSVLQEIKTLYCPQARRPERDLLSDAPGRSFDSGGQGRHAVEPRTGVRQQISERFAREIADELEAGRTRGDYDELVLVAPADLAGTLKGALSRGCLQRVGAEVHKNIVAREIPVILDALPFVVRNALKRGNA